MATNRKHLISASANIPAPPQRAYSILANYRDEHPRILPPQFSNLAGRWNGSVCRFQIPFESKFGLYPTASQKQAVSESGRACCFVSCIATGYRARPRSSR